MIITISGSPGSGKSTVGKILADRLCLKRYYMGQILRDMAKKKGMTIREFMEYAETDSIVDKEVDNYQKKLGEIEDDIIVEGRTSFFLIPNSVKIFLDVSFDVGAERIFKELQKDGGARNEGKFSSLEAVKEDLKKRVASEKKRYMMYYKKDIYDKKQYDCVIDTSDLSVEQVLDGVMKCINAADKKQK